MNPWDAETIAKSDRQDDFIKRNKLKIWNGRGFGEYSSLYACAKSQKHVVEMCRQAGHKMMNLAEVQNYWSFGCWGIPMLNVHPEIGLWATTDKEPDKPIRLI